MKYTFDKMQVILANFLKVFASVLRSSLIFSSACLVVLLIHRPDFGSFLRRSLNKTLDEKCLSVQIVFGLYCIVYHLILYSYRQEGYPLNFSKKTYVVVTH